MTVILRTRDGQSYSLSGYASDVQKVVNDARGKGQLIPLERERIPTGQHLWVDPDEVIVIKDER